MNVHSKFSCFIFRVSLRMQLKSFFPYIMIDVGFKALSCNCGGREDATISWVLYCQVGNPWYFTVQSLSTSHSNVSINFNAQKQLSGGVLLKGVLKNFAEFTREHLCRSIFFDKVPGDNCNFSIKETLALVFSYKFCKIF